MRKGEENNVHRFLTVVACYQALKSIDKIMKLKDPQLPFEVDEWEYIDYRRNIPQDVINRRKEIEGEYVGAVVIGKKRYDFYYVEKPKTLPMSENGSYTSRAELN